MNRYKVRFRIPSGTWMESVFMSGNPLEAQQYAYAVYGQSNVMMVWQENLYE